MPHSPGSISQHKVVTVLLILIVILSSSCFHSHRFINLNNSCINHHLLYFPCCGNKLYMFVIVDGHLFFNIMHV